jgi:LmeA-like phospholipid-binding
VLAAVVLLAIAQLALPGIAAQALRDRLSRSGRVLDVRVEAFPAIELLWHQADKVVIRMQEYRSNPSNLSSTLAQARDVGSLDASAAQVQSGLLTLRDATLHKRGDQLTGSARVTESDLRAAIPILDSVQPIASGDGQLTLRGTATLLGVTASVDATVQAQNGQLVVQPNVPFGALATISVFSNPHLAVQGVSASAAPGGFSVSATGRLR